MNKQYGKREDLEKGSKAKIHHDTLKTTLKKVLNWKTPNPYGIHGYWFKNSLPSMTDWLAKPIDANIPEWMTKGKTTLIQKGTAPYNYRPITCLPMMWIILTAKIREAKYDSISHWLLPDKQKGCRKWTRGTEELLCIDQNILKGKQDEMKKPSYGVDWL